MAFGHEASEVRAALDWSCHRVVDRRLAREPRQQGGAVAREQEVELSHRCVGERRRAGAGRERQESAERDAFPATSHTWRRASRFAQTKDHIQSTVSAGGLLHALVRPQLIDLSGRPCLQLL